MDTGFILFSSKEAASTFAEKDPYVTKGLVKRWEVREWTVVVGTLFPSLEVQK